MVGDLQRISSQNRFEVTIQIDNIKCPITIFGRIYLHNQGIPLRLS